MRVIPRLVPQPAASSQQMGTVWGGGMGLVETVGGCWALAALGELFWAGQLWILGWAGQACLAPAGWHRSAGKNVFGKVF